VHVYLDYLDTIHHSQSPLKSLFSGLVVFRSWRSCLAHGRLCKIGRSMAVASVTMIKKGHAGLWDGLSRQCVILVVTKER